MPDNPRVRQGVLGGVGAREFLLVVGDEAVMADSRAGILAFLGVEETESARFTYCRRDAVEGGRLYNPRLSEARRGRHIGTRHASVSY